MGANNNARSQREVTEFAPAANICKCQGPLRESSTVADAIKPRTGRGGASIAEFNNSLPRESLTMTVATTFVRPSPKGRAFSERTLANQAPEAYTQPAVQDSRVPKSFQETLPCRAMFD
jgi:hypothetical protein